MDKNELRKHYKNKRAEFTPLERSEASVKIAEQIIEKWNFSNEVINVFLPIERFYEVNTNHLIHSITTKNRICAPVSDFTSLTLKHVEITAKTKIEISKWGIPEPKNDRFIEEKDISIVIVPLLISDRKGYRLGYGKGFYDRFLAKCPHSLKIGINYFEPMDELPGIDQYDIPIDYLVTPEKVLKSEQS